MTEKIKNEPKPLKAFEARDKNGALIMVAVWSDNHVTLCQLGKDQTQDVCHTSLCKEGQEAEECYQEAKKLFGQRFGLQIEELGGQ